MKIRKSLIAGITAASLSAGFAVPAQADTSTHIQAAQEAPKTASPMGSINSIWNATPNWLRIPLFAPLGLLVAIMWGFADSPESTKPFGQLSS